MKAVYSKYASTLPFILAAVCALLLAAALNTIISRQKAERFKASLSFPQQELKELILKQLSSYGIESSSIQSYRDEDNVLHLKVDASLSLYGEIEKNLKNKIARFTQAELKIEEKENENKGYYLWEVKSRNGKSIFVLFSCRKKIAFEGEQEKGRAVIIIDDMGYSLESLKKVFSFNKPLTISILPFSPHAKKTAQIAHENGLEVMLHLPLESANNNGNNDVRGIILSRMSEEEVKKRLEENLNQVPYIKGVNNHMGSRITASKTVMMVILEEIKKKNLFFVDSVTTTKSVAHELAQKMGLPSARRDIFLDSIANKDSIKRKLTQLFRLARKKGTAVGICHPFEETLEVLEKYLGLADEYDVELVSVSRIIQLSLRKNEIE
ncbi:MAG: divergent polysaccharide deacetylase family protein [Candidatus Aminicenantales bacterium]